MVLGQSKDTIPKHYVGIWVLMVLAELVIILYIFEKIVRENVHYIH